MTCVLRVAGAFNILAGAAMCCLYHEGYRLLGVKKPELMLPLQLVGVMVALFGVGYLLTAHRPMENRNVLMLGFWSKALGSVLGVYYSLAGPLPLWFLIVLFFADIIYLPFFALIMRRLHRLAAGDRSGRS
jgi:CDP-diglyceride synthetase